MSKKRTIRFIGDADQIPVFGEPFTLKKIEKLEVPDSMSPEMTLSGRYSLKEAKAIQTLIGIDITDGITMKQITKMGIPFEYSHWCRKGEKKAPIVVCGNVEGVERFNIQFELWKTDIKIIEEPDDLIDALGPED